jgi:hypothetical protein
MSKCICRSVNIQKTGHREDCPERKTAPAMIRQASPGSMEQKELLALVKNLLRTVRAQEERITLLEQKLISF